MFRVLFHLVFCVVFTLLHWQVMNIHMYEEVEVDSSSSNSH